VQVDIFVFVLAGMNRTDFLHNCNDINMIWKTAGLESFDGFRLTPSLAWAWTLQMSASRSYADSIQQYEEDRSPADVIGRSIKELGVDAELFKTETFWYKNKAGSSTNSRGKK
jgi:hypothetical protein